MRNNLAFSLVFLLVGAVACGGGAANGDAGAGGTSASGEAGGAGGASAAGANAGGTSGGAGGAGSGVAGSAGQGSAGQRGGGTAGHGTAGATGGGAGGAGHGGASGSSGSGGAPGGGGTSGAGGAGKPCIDTECPGACEGASCGGAWTCDTQVACSAIATQYCGCDGKTFTGSSCAQRAYQFRGTCEAGVSCDQTKVLCKIATPVCQAGSTPSVDGSCYGPCVPIGMCACATSAQCPSTGTTSCDTATMRCATK
jgi:hypothetical protein